MARRRPHITVVGLGPADSDLLGAGASTLLAERERVYLRTARHPAAAALHGARAFDDLYESAATFDEVYAAIVEELVVAAVATAPDPVVYAVPGSPLVAERTVELLRADDRVELTILPALSFLDLAWAALGIDPLAEGVRLVDAAAFGLAAGGERAPSGGAVLVAPPAVRGEARRGDEADRPLPRPVLLHHLGLPDEVVARVDWWELDRTLEPDHLTSLYVPALAQADRSSGEEVARLAVLMDTLRQRCPWDRAQTHASLMPHLVEECYEVLDALAALAGPTATDDAFAHLKEELGDLLFQIVFHARLADEEGHFDLAAVARGVHDKLVHRHPHVFSDIDAADADQVMTNWEAIKKSEKGRSSMTEGIPSELPALMLTTKLARKARSVGLEPDHAGAPADTADVVASLTRLAHGVQPSADDPLSSEADELSGQVGELLFVVANLAQRLGVDAEQALRARALALRAEILAAEGVPDQDIGNR